MAGGSRTPKVDKTVRDFRDLGLALRGIVTQFKAMTAPLSGVIGAMKELARVADKSLTTGVTVDKLKKYGAALKALGGDVNDAAKTFGYLDTQVAKMKLGESNALGDLAWKFNFRLDGDEDADEMMDKIREAMSGLGEQQQREFAKALGLSDSMFRMAKMSADEYRVAKERASELTFDEDRTKEMTANSLKLQAALGNLSTAWGKIKMAIGDVFTIFSPLIEWLASVIAWVAESKTAVTIFAVVLGGFVVAKVLRLAKGIMNLVGVFKAIPGAASKVQSLVSALGRLWKWNLTAGGGFGKPFTKVLELFKKFGSVIRHPINSIRSLWHGIKNIYTAVKGSGEMFQKAFNLMGFAIKHPIQSVKMLYASLSKIGKVGAAVAKGFRSAFGIVKGVIGGVGAVFKGIGGLAKGIFGGIIGAFMFCVESLSFAWDSFDKYILGNLGMIKSFFTDTCGQMFDSWDDFCSIIGGLFSGFLDGLAEGLGNVGKFLVNFFTLGLLSEDTLDKVQGWFQDFFDSLFDFSWIVHPFDTVCNLFNGTIDSVVGIWRGARRLLPSWLGGYSKEEKEKLDAEDAAKKKIEDAKNADKQIEKNRKDHEKQIADFKSRKAAMQEGAKKLALKVSDGESEEDFKKRFVENARSLGKVTDQYAENRYANMAMQSYRKQSMANAANNIAGNLANAGQKVQSANSAAAGASSMVQTTNDNRSSVQTNASNTSVKVDGIIINAKTDNPQKLGTELMSELNSYRNYGLSVTTSLAGQT